MKYEELSSELQKSLAPVLEEKVNSLILNFLAVFIITIPKPHQVL